MHDAKIENKFDESAKDWDADPGRVKTAKDVANAIRKRITLNKNMYALDYGCGTGLVTMELQPFVRHLTAIDTSRGMLDALNNKLDRQQIKNVNTSFIRSENDTLPKIPYDLILSSMTLHHVEDHILLLKKFYQMLKKKGIIAIADLVEESGDFHSDNSHVHHYGFEKDKFIALIKSIGFSNVKFEIVHQIEKENANGALKSFPVFLLTAEK